MILLKSLKVHIFHHLSSSHVSQVVGLKVKLLSCVDSL